MSSKGESQRLSNLSNRRELLGDSPKIPEWRGPTSKEILDCLESLKSFRKLTPDELVKVLKDFSKFVETHAQSIVDDTIDKTFVDAIDTAVEQFSLT